MTVQISNTELTDNFNSWRLNTNLIATTIGNNTITIEKAGRGGFTRGSGHVSGNLTATTLATNTLRGGNTAGYRNLVIASNTHVNATFLSVTSNTTFQGNVIVATSGDEVFDQGSVSRIRMTGGTPGHFLRKNPQNRVEYKSLSLRDIQDMSSNSAHLILSGANTSFSDNRDSTHLIFGSQSDRVHVYLAKDTTAGDSDLFVNLVDDGGDSRFVIADSSNTVVGYIDSDGNADFSGTLTVDGTTTLNGDVVLGDASTDTITVKGNFANASFDGDVDFNGDNFTFNGNTRFNDTMYINGNVIMGDQITDTFTATSNTDLQGDVDLGNANSDFLTVTSEVDSNFVPNANNTYSLGKHQKQWKHIFVQNANVASQLTVDGSASVGSLTSIGTATFNGDMTLGDADTDTITVKGKFANQATTGTASFNGTTHFNGNVNLGSDDTDIITVNGKFANQATTGTASFNGTTHFNGTTNMNGTLNLNGTVNVGDAAADQLNITSEANLNGLVDIGNANTDTLTVLSEVDSHFVPATNNTYLLGKTTKKWKKAFVGRVESDSLNNTGKITTSTLHANGNVDFDAKLDVAGKTTLQILHANGAVDFDSTLNVDGGTTLNGDVTLGNQTTDDITITGKVVGGFTANGASITVGEDRTAVAEATRYTMYGNGGITTFNVYANTVFHDNVTLAGDEIAISGTAALTSLEVTGASNMKGNVDLGDAAADTISINGSIDTNIIPTGSCNLGSSANKWNDLYVGGNAVIDGSLSNSGTTLFSSAGVLNASDTIADDAITNAMLANPSITLTADSGTDQTLNLGQTFDIEGGEGIDTVVGATRKITIKGEDASTSNKGIAKFDSGDFSVSSGSVSLKNATTGAVLAINGTSNEVNVSRTNGTVTVGLPDDVSIAGQLNVGENVVISGNLTVSGTTTTVNTETVNIADNIIVLNSNYSGSTPTENGGITIERGTLTNKQFIWNETDDKWSVGSETMVAGTFEGALSGNASTATKLATARTISSSGDVSWSVSFDGSGNATGTATIQPNSVALGTDTTGNYVATAAAGNGISVSGSGSETAAITVTNTKPYDYITIQDGDSTTYTLTNQDTLQIAEGTNIDSNFTADDVLTISHKVPTGATSGAKGSAGIASITTDSTGHVTSVTTATYDNYVSWTAKDHDGTTYTITSGDVLWYKEGNGIDVNFTADDTLTITNTKPFDAWVLEDGDGTEVSITNNKEVKFIEGSGTGATIDINWTDTSTGSDGDPFDLTFTVTNTDRGSSQNIFKTFTVTDTDSGYTWTETGNVVADNNNDTVKFVSGNKIDIDVDAASDAIRIAHTDTSTLSGAYGSSGVSSITVDNAGHVTAISTATYDNYVSWTARADSGTDDAITSGEVVDFIGGTAIDTSIADAGVTINHADTSTLSGTYGQSSTEDGTYIKSVTVDGMGHVTAITSDDFDDRYLGISSKAADSDKLDGINSTSFLRSDANDTASGVITFSNTTESSSTTTGAVKLSGGMGVVKNVYVGGTLVESSDKRIKSNIEKIDGALDKVMNLNGYTYDKEGSEKRQTGVIAQEVMQVLPEAVVGTEEEWGVSYGNMVGLLIEAIKEQQKEIEELKKKLV